MFRARRLREQRLTILRSLWLPAALAIFQSRLAHLGRWLVSDYGSACEECFWRCFGRLPHEINLNLLHIFYALIACLLIAAVVVTLVGTWAASRVESLHGTKDPHKVVIDEVAGQLIALIAIPLQAETWWTIVLAFLLFRFFDIVKPYPARNFENLHGGLGIMADDVVAGIYAAICVAVIVSVAWFT